MMCGHSVRRTQNLTRFDRLRSFKDPWSEGQPMRQSYTATYTRLPAGYMGQLMEWPDVVIEGDDLDACKAMLCAALHDVISAYRDLRLESPGGNALLGERAGLAPKH